MFNQIEQDWIIVYIFNPRPLLVIQRLQPHWLTYRRVQFQKLKSKLVILMISKLSWTLS